ncbi:MAG: VWA domain-containing protein [Acidobacteriota bacterium]
MNFLNLGLGELLGLLGAVSAGVVALYLLDRTKRHQIVSTMRFWIAAGSRTDLKHRKRIQQPWSLLLQLLSLALLLIAIAGPQFGVFDGPGSDHVVVLDTSAWMGAITAQGTLLDQSKANALAYLRTLPRRDRVMLVRADALATPATAFELDRGIVQNAIQQSQAGASGLNLTLALDFAQRAQSLQSARPGEIVFIGAGRVKEEEVNLRVSPTNLRVISSTAPVENVGLRKVALRRSTTAPESWDIFVVVHNYGTKTRAVDLALQYAQSPAGTRRITLGAGKEEEAAFSYKEKTGGFLEARLNVRDSFPQDDRAVVEVPSQTALRAIVYSSDPQALRSLFTTNPVMETEFRAPSAYDPAAKADLIVLDRFAPPSPPRTPAIWVEPPATGSPIPVRSVLTNVALERWSPDSTLGAGIYTRDVTLDSTEVFSPAAGDITVAVAGGGPVIVAREGAVKQLVIGFNPGRGSMKYELATPLLIANALRWMTPGTYRRWELQAGTVGSTIVPVEKSTTAAEVRVLDDSNQALPFTVENGLLRFFEGTPGTVRVQIGDRELVYSMTLPDLGDAAWKVPSRAATGIPKTSLAGSTTTDVWPWLAIAGALGLLADWILFGRTRAVRVGAGKSASLGIPWRKAS